ncbi:MAG TPA: peptide chain release factor 2 [Candidatus Acidoferrum sp.]|nr:peptide chain release factor 2 [Candidatus Acidoferrum sp.]
MQQIKDRLASLSAQLEAVQAKLRINILQDELKRLQASTGSSDFWQDSQKAQKLLKQESKLRAQLEPLQALSDDINDLAELVTVGDESLVQELAVQLEKTESKFQLLRHDLLFSGKYDTYDAILRLHAGAGGTDAQDWTEMLQRMYLRWAERSGMKAEIIEESPGEEAGLKSATLSISGPYAYGKLRSEHGVHRLVRLSPFNADHLRQTSFALVEILPQIDAPDEVRIDENDLKIDVFRSGGKGGQSVNTTDSAVRITHLPTGIVVSIQNERSQLQNKEAAMKILRSKLAQLQLEQHKEHLSELKGPAQSAEWGNQIRNYVMQPYTLVKDNRTKHEEHDVQAVLDGKLDEFMTKFLELT